MSISILLDDIIEAYIIEIVCSKSSKVHSSYTSLLKEKLSFQKWTVLSADILLDYIPKFLILMKIITPKIKHNIMI